MYLTPDKRNYYYYYDKATNGPSSRQSFESLMYWLSQKLFLLWKELTWKSFAYD